MITLNLTATGPDQIRIKEYLEQNVSDMLAYKINNGVKIQKDNKTLLNKKDLNGFVNFACDEAKKQAEKGARSAMVADEIVFGWAVHYFEEDTIEGKLYNEDGSEYKPAPKVKPKTTVTITPPAPKPQNQQTSLFDLLTPQNSTETKDVQEVDEDEDDTEIYEEILENFENETKSDEKVEKIEQKCEKVEEEPQNIAFYKDKLVDKDGVILTDEEIANSFDKHTMYILSSLLDGKLELQ